MNQRRRKDDEHLGIPPVLVLKGMYHDWYSFNPGTMTGDSKGKKEKSDIRTYVQED